MYLFWPLFSALFCVVCASKPVGRKFPAKVSKPLEIFEAAIHIQDPTVDARVYADAGRLHWSAVVAAVRAHKPYFSRLASLAENSLEQLQSLRLLTLWRLELEAVAQDSDRKKKAWFEKFGAFDFPPMAKLDLRGETLYSDKKDHSPPWMFGHGSGVPVLEALNKSAAQELGMRMPGFRLPHGAAAQLVKANGAELVTLSKGKFAEYQVDLNDDVFTKVMEATKTVAGVMNVLCSPLLLAGGLFQGCEASVRQKSRKTTVPVSVMNQSNWERPLIFFERFAEVKSQVDFVSPVLLLGNASLPLVVGEPSVLEFLSTLPDGRTINIARHLWGVGTSIHRDPTKLFGAAWHSAALAGESPGQGRGGQHKEWALQHKQTSHLEVNLTMLSAAYSLGASGGAVSASTLAGFKRSKHPTTDKGYYMFRGNDKRSMYSILRTALRAVGVPLWPLKALYEGTRSVWQPSQSSQQAAVTSVSSLPGWWRRVHLWAKRRGIVWALYQIWHGGDVLFASIFPPRDMSYTRPEVLSLNHLLGQIDTATEQVNLALRSRFDCFKHYKRRVSRAQAVSIALCLALNPSARSLVALRATSSIGITNIIDVAQDASKIRIFQNFLAEKGSVESEQSLREQVSASAAGISMQLRWDGSVWKRSEKRETAWTQVCAARPSAFSIVSSHCKSFRLTCAARPTEFITMALPSAAELQVGARVVLGQDNGHVLEVATALGCEV